MTGQNDPQTFAVIGAAMEVHRALGRGFVESVYREALAFEFTALNIPYQKEVPLGVHYKGAKLPCTFRMDFLCFGDLILELKVIQKLSPVEDAQVINYLRASGFQRALLLNFGSPSLQHKRFVFSKNDIDQIGN